MSDQSFDYAEPEGEGEGGQQGDDGDNLVTLRRSQIRTLEDRAKRFSAADARATAAERRLAFIEAGVDPKDPKVNYFIKGYDGKIEAEAIRKAALDAGFITEATEDKPPATQDQQKQQQTGAPDQMTPEDAATATQREALAAMAAATRDLGIPGQGPALQQQMLAALQRGGAEGLAEVLRTAGLPVVEQ